MSALIDNSSNNDDESDEDKSMDVFEQFLKYRKKKASRKKCTNSLVHEAIRLIQEIQRKNGGEPKNCTMKKPLLNRSWEEPLVSKETPLQLLPQEEKERKPPKERTVKPSRTELCKSGWSTHGPTTKSRNTATKGYNKRIYMTRKGNVGSKK